MSELFIGNYFDNYTLATVTDDVIQFAQEKLKVELPLSYLTLMTTQNGGELHRRKLIIGEEVLSVDYLNGIGAKTGEGILLSSSLKREWGLSSKFVYLFGDGHTWLALDYRRYKGNNPPVTYIDLEQNMKQVIAEDFTAFLGQLTYDESLQHSAYEYGEELEHFPREDVERVMKSCNHAYMMSAGMHYYGFTEEDLTWYFTQLYQYINAFINEGYSPYEKPDRSVSMIDYFLNCTIAIIRKREIDLRDYPIAMEALQLFANFPPKYDFKGMVQRKAQKILGYLEL